MSIRRLAGDIPEAFEEDVSNSTLVPWMLRQGAARSMKEIKDKIHPVEAAARFQHQEAARKAASHCAKKEALVK